MAIEPILAHGAVLDKGAAIFLVAKCQVASAASYPPQKKAEGKNSPCTSSSLFHRHASGTIYCGWEDSAQEAQAFKGIPWVHTPPSVLQPGPQSSQGSDMVRGRSRAKERRGWWRLGSGRMLKAQIGSWLYNLFNQLHFNIFHCLIFEEGGVFLTVGQYMDFMKQTGKCLSSRRKTLLFFDSSGVSYPEPQRSQNLFCQGGL